MKRAISGILLAATVLVFTTALGLAVIHITDFPYVLDVDLLNIGETAKLSHEEILLNYNAMLDYLSPFSNEKFTLPTLSYTEVASSHFADCKVLFNSVYLLGLLSGLVLAFIAFNNSASKRVLKLSGTITLAVPAVLGAVMFTGFDWAFDFFHSILFAEKTWLFDPKLDEIITILPSEFFMHCGIFIALFWVGGAALQLSIGYSKQKYR